MATDALAFSNFAFAPIIIFGQTDAIWLLDIDPETL